MTISPIGLTSPESPDKMRLCMQWVQSMASLLSWTQPLTSSQTGGIPTRVPLTTTHTSCLKKTGELSCLGASSMIKVDLMIMRLRANVWTVQASLWTVHCSMVPLGLLRRIYMATCTEQLIEINTIKINLFIRCSVSSMKVDWREESWFMTNSDDLTFKAEMMANLFMRPGMLKRVLLTFLGE